MKRSFFAFLFVSCLLVGSAYADQGDLSFGFDTGQVGLTSPGMSSFGTNGFGFGGYLTYAASELFALDMNVIYSQHSGNGSYGANAFYPTLALKFGMTFDQLSPYLTTGIGVYRTSFHGTMSDIANYNYGAATAFGFNIGGGLDIDLGKMFIIGLLVRYHPVLGKSVTGVPGGAGVDDMWDALFRIGVKFKTETKGGWD